MEELLREFWARKERDRLKPQESALFMELAFKAQSEGFPKWFSITNEVLYKKLDAANRNSLIKWRKKLVSLGYIKHKNTNRRENLYSIKILGQCIKNDTHSVSNQHDQCIKNDTHTNPTVSVVEGILQDGSVSNCHNQCIKNDTHRVSKMIHIPAETPAKIGQCIKNDTLESTINRGIDGILDIGSVSKMIHIPCKTDVLPTVDAMDADIEGIADQTAKTVEKSVIEMLESTQNTAFEPVDNSQANAKLPQIASIIVRACVRNIYIILLTLLERESIYKYNNKYLDRSDQDQDLDHKQDHKAMTGGNKREKGGVGGKEKKGGIEKPISRNAEAKTRMDIPEDAPTGSANPRKQKTGDSPKKKKGFAPPTLDEVKAYAESRDSIVDPKTFWEYFDAGGWRDSKGNEVKAWKQKFLTWERMEKERGQAAPKPSEDRGRVYDRDDWSTPEARQYQYRMKARKDEAETKRRLSQSAVFYREQWWSNIPEDGFPSGRPFDSLEDLAKASREIYKGVEIRLIKDGEPEKVMLDGEIGDAPDEEFDPWDNVWKPRAEKPV